MENAKKEKQEEANNNVVPFKQLAKEENDVPLVFQFSGLSNEEAAQKATEYYTVLDRKEQYAINAALEITVFKGEMLYTLKEEKGNEVFLEACKATGISRQTGYNYIKLYQNHKNEFIAQLEPTKALMVISVLNDPDTKVTKDSIIFPDGQTLCLKDIQDSTKKEVKTLLIQCEKKDRELEKKDEDIEKLKKSHEREKDTLCAALNKLQGDVISRKHKLHEDTVSMIKTYVSMIKGLLENYIDNAEAVCRQGDVEDIYGELNVLKDTMKKFMREVEENIPAVQEKA